MSLQTNVKSLMNSNLNGLSGLAMNMGSAPSAPPLAVPIHHSRPSVALLQKMEERITFLEKQTSAKQTVGNSMTVQFEGQLFNCQQDMENYVHTLSGSSSIPVSLVNDYYTLLQAVVLSIQGDSIDIREIHSIGQMGSNISEADVKNESSVPPSFKGTSKLASIYTGESAGAKHRLKGIPTYSFWGKPGSVDGLRY